MNAKATGEGRASGRTPQDSLREALDELSALVDDWTTDETEPPSSEETVRILAEHGDR